MKPTEPPATLILPPLFAACHLSVSELVRTQYGKGKLVEDRSGEKACAVLVESGAVDVFSVALDGNEVLLSTLSEGDMFGICNLFEEDELRTVLQCKTDCALLSVSKTVLRDAILKHPEAMAEYASLCNRKIQFLIRRIEQLSLNSARMKLVEHLLSQSSSEGVECLRPATKESLSLMLGVSRAALYRELASLQELGAIRSEGSRIIIMDREILESFLQ